MPSRVRRWNGEQWVVIIGEGDPITPVPPTPPTPPVAEFSSTTTGLSVAFNGGLSSDSDGTIVTYSWNFGDGLFGTGVTPTHIYDTAGTYAVTLTVTDNVGARASVSHAVQTAGALNTPPVAGFTFAADALTVNFNGTASGDPDGTIAAFDWSFGDGTTSLTVPGPSSTPIFTETWTAAALPAGLKNTFEGTAGASFTTSSTATSGDTNASAVTLGTGSTAVYSTAKGSAQAGGSTALALTWTNQQSSATFPFASSSTSARRAFRFWVWAPSAFVAVEDTRLYTDRTAAGVQIADVHLQQGGNLTFRNASNTVVLDSGSTHLPTNQWVLVKGAVTVATGMLELAFYNPWNLKTPVWSDVIDFAGLGNTAGGQVLLGAAVSNSNAATFYFDDLYVTEALSTGFPETRLPAWPSAWSQPSWSAATTNIQGDKGQLTTAASAYAFGTMLRDGTLGQADVTVTLQTAVSGVEQSVFVYIDTDSSGNNYSAQFYYNTNLFALGKDTAGSGSSLGQVTVPITATSPHKIRVQRIGKTIRAKVWQASAAEPVAWTLSYAEPGATHTGTGYQLAFMNGTDGVARTISFDDWTLRDATTSGSATISHTYAAAGTYNAQLTVTDNQGATGSVSHSVSVASVPVPNTPPVASFTPTMTNQSLAVNGSASSDSDGTIASYSWSWGDGTTAGSGVTANHTYAAPGTYTVTLTVTDNQGLTATTSRSVTATAANRPPVASFTASVTNLTATVNATASSDPDGTIASYSWSWGDNSTSSGANQSHTYGADGTYTITLTVTDNAGASTTTTRSVTTTAPPATDGFVLGTTKPGAQWAGIGITSAPPTTRLKGDLVVRTSNQVYDHLIIEGKVIINSGVTGTVIRHCKVELRGNYDAGSGTYSNYTSQVVGINASSGTDTSIEFTEISGELSNNGTGWGDINGIGTKNFRAYRCNIHHVTDGIRVNNPSNTNGGLVNVRIEGCWIHDLIVDAPDPTNSGRTDKKTHSDGIQVEGGTSILIDGNTIQAYKSTDGTSSMTYTYKVGSAWVATTASQSGASLQSQANAAIILTGGTTISQLTIKRNWLGGGETTVNGADGGSGVLQDNLFDRGSRNNASIYPTSGGLTRSGNDYEDNGASVPGGG